MQIKFSEDVILDSRRAILLPRQETLVLADLFLGLGAARRKRPTGAQRPAPRDLGTPAGPAGRHQPKRVVLLGDIKPTRATGGRGREELRALFQKLQGHGREVIQVVAIRSGPGGLPWRTPGSSRWTPTGWAPTP